MKFKVNENTPTWQKLMEISNQILEANNKAALLAKNLGAKSYCRNRQQIGGGIDALEFLSPPEGYKKVGQSWERWYQPRAKNIEVKKQIAELPVINCKELNQTIGFNSPQVVVSEDGGLMMVSVPLIIWDDKQIILSIPNQCKYTPTEDIDEILESDFERIKNEINAVLKKESE